MSHHFYSFAAFYLAQDFTCVGSQFLSFDNSYTHILHFYFHYNCILRCLMPSVKMPCGA